MRPNRRYHLLVLDIYRKVQGALTLTSFRNRTNQPGDDEWLPGADTVTESVAPPLVKLGGVQSSNVARAKKGAEDNGVDKEESRHFTVSSYEKAELLVTELVPLGGTGDII